MIRFRPFSINFTLASAFVCVAFALTSIAGLLAQNARQAAAIDRLGAELAAVRGADLAALNALAEENRRINRRNARALAAVAEKVGAKLPPEEERP